jgi:hypothetical protein
MTTGEMEEIKVGGRVKLTKNSHSAWVRKRGAGQAFTWQIGVPMQQVSDNPTPSRFQLNFKSHRFDSLVSSHAPTHLSPEGGGKGHSLR